MTPRVRRQVRARVATGVLLATLVAGCGDARDEGPEAGVGDAPTAAASSPAPRTTSEPVGKAAGVPTRLGPGDPRPGIVCADGARATGFFDFAAGAKGDPTPEEAVERRLAAGESFVMTEDGGTAWVLRPDGTAHTRLSLVHLRGWLVDTTDGCPGGE
ncbi:hypothetical protein G7072_08025 [Nocardioides sp. HDW12B]|uniref:hypothetical protein n=1 Tax=Nocardioides sp. HDW12B TaxID=2714939 RepID=UPI00140B0144|nr:hypothetical protein [Nocardioides sp. HDW12B]QIK66304.1 hypothetical protein G7072_08025 [Nocardioides sp. HDW12B]